LSWGGHPSGMLAGNVGESLASMDMPANSIDEAHMETLLGYLNGPFQKINGWCSPNIWQVIWPIVYFQESIGIKNPVGEIGVFHGKFFIGLMLTKGVNCNYAIDVFDMQEFNLDGAGVGDLETFKANLTECGIAASSVEIIRTDSTSLTYSDIIDIRRKSKGFSLFSVDGCHLPAHTINDIRVAIALTVSQGLIFVDDYTNPHWPGVQEGVAKLFLNECPTFIPLAFAHNKLVLCHLSYHGKFINILIESLKKESITYKLVKRFGYDSVSVNLDAANHNFLPDLH
jgi:hypothetical protein